MLGRRRGERGSVTVFTAVFAIAVIFLLALILDGGSALNRSERAMDIHQRPARRRHHRPPDAAQRRRGDRPVPGGASPVKGYGNCWATGWTTTHHDGEPHRAARGGREVGLGVHQPAGARIPAAFHESAQASATPECGINQGAPC